MPSPTLTEAQARTLVNRFKVNWENMHGAIIALWEGQGWLSLGYDSWADLCAAELNMKLQLPVMARRSIVSSLTEHGMSSRAIGSALSVNPETVNRDRRAANAAPAAITGTDGKRYRMEPPREPETIPARVTIAPQPEPVPVPPRVVHIDRVGPMGEVDRVARELCTLLGREPARQDSPERRVLLGDLLALIEDRRAEWDL